VILLAAKKSKSPSKSKTRNKTKPKSKTNTNTINNNKREVDTMEVINLEIQNKDNKALNNEIQTEEKSKLNSDVSSAADPKLKPNDCILDQIPNLNKYLGKRGRSSFIKQAAKMKITQEELLALVVQATIKKKIKFEKKTVYVAK
jgi:hypothetical protein